MSRTMIISSWSAPSTTVTSCDASCPIPAKTSRYMRATRAGVSRRPPRSGSSPIPSRISRTPSSIFASSNRSSSIAARCYREPARGRSASRQRIPESTCRSRICIRVADHDRDRLGSSGGRRRARPGSPCRCPAAGPCDRSRRLPSWCPARNRRTPWRERCPSTRPAGREIPDSDRARRAARDSALHAADRCAGSGTAGRAHAEHHDGDDRPHLRWTRPAAPGFRLRTHTQRAGACR